MTTINDIISKLRNLDLSSRPEKEIIDLYRTIGPTVNIIVNIGLNKTFLKARPNNNQPRFTETKDLSIKPAKSNNLYQRASTPLKNMFYCVYMSNTELDIMRRTGVYETIPDIREPNKSFDGKVTFGYWTNKENLNLIAVIHKKTYATTNSYTKELIDAYKKYILGCDNLLIENTMSFYDFLANEFSKENIRGDYDYMISALFSEAASRLNIDGVIYPSVRVGGFCYCVAISESAMQKLELDCVEEAMVNQTDNVLNIFINAFAKLEKNQTRFNLVDVAKNIR